MVVDGHKQQLNAISPSIEQYRAQTTTLILDFIRVLEYLWKAAYCFHPEGSEAAEQWVHERALLILDLQGFGVRLTAGSPSYGELCRCGTSDRKRAGTPTPDAKRRSRMEWYTSPHRTR
jgi:hypothetical protein